MANPVVYKQDSAEAGATTLFIQFAVGATGAVGALVPNRSKEFRKTTPVVRTGAGVYDIFLREPWLALLDQSVWCIGPVAPTAGTTGKVTTNNVSTAGAPKVTVTYYAPNGGAAADPSNGDTACVTLIVKRFKPL